MKNKSLIKKAMSVITVLALSLSLMTGIPFSEINLGVNATAETCDECTEYENGFCTTCGSYQEAPISNNFYQISNAGQLYWFAELVNSGNSNSYNAVLTNDIIVNTGVFDSDGNLVSDTTSFREWTPIGNKNGSDGYYFQGNFNGQGHTVSGLYFNDGNTSNVGLFGAAMSCNISNVGVLDSYFYGNRYVGAVCGYTQVGARLTNCYSNSHINSYGMYAGGIAGYSYTYLSNSYNIGKVNGGNSTAGAIAGVNHTVVNNCYYLTGCATDGKDVTQYGIGHSGLGGSNPDTEGVTTGMTSEQFESGEVAYLLGDGWYQNIGTDPYPVLDSTHSKVYKYCDGTSVIYTNDSSTPSTHKDEDHNGICDLCDDYLDGFSAILAGYTISLNGNIAVNFYMELSDEIVNDTGAYMHFTLPNGEVSDIPVLSAETVDMNGVNYYVFTCEVASFEMTQDIKAQIIDGNGNKGTEYTYTVRDYAEYIINNPASYTDEDVTFAKKLLNYGTASQNYFNVSTNDLANKNLDSADSAITIYDATTLSSYKKPASTTALGRFEGYSLSLLSETTLKVYFKVADGINASNLTFTANGNNVNAVLSGEYYVLSVENIEAFNLDKDYEFTVSDGTDTATYSCSAMSYSYSVLAGGYENDFKTLVSALYDYNVASEYYAQGAEG